MIGKQFTFETNFYSRQSTITNIVQILRSYRIKKKAKHTDIMLKALIENYFI